MVHHHEELENELADLKARDTQNTYYHFILQWSRINLPVHFVVLSLPLNVVYKFTWVVCTVTIPIENEEKHYSHLKNASVVEMERKKEKEKEPEPEFHALSAPSGLPSSGEPIRSVEEVKRDTNEQQKQHFYSVPTRTTPFPSAFTTTVSSTDKSHRPFPVVYPVTPIPFTSAVSPAPKISRVPVSSAQPAPKVARAPSNHHWNSIRTLE